MYTKIFFEPGNGSICTILHSFCKTALWAPNTENSEKAKLCTLMYTPVAFSEFSYYLLFCILWMQ